MNKNLLYSTSWLLLTFACIRPSRVTLDPTGAPFGFHLTRYYYYLRTQQCFPNLSVLGLDSSFLSCVLNQVLEVLGPSASIIYALGQMDNSSESTESVMALNRNLVRADSLDSAQPLMPIRSSRFASVPYAAEHVIFALWRLRLEDLRRFYQIPELISLRVPALHEWASSCLLNEVSIFKQILEASLRFSIPMFFRQLLTHLCLAPRQVMPNRWRILIACMVLW